MRVKNERPKNKAEFPLVFLRFFKTRSRNEARPPQGIAAFVILLHKTKKEPRAFCQRMAEGRGVIIVVFMKGLELDYWEDPVVR